MVGDHIRKLWFYVKRLKTTSMTRLRFFDVPWTRIHTRYAASSDIILFMNISSKGHVIDDYYVDTKMVPMCVVVKMYVPLD